MSEKEVLVNVNDRSLIPEQTIFKLWEQKYFNSLTLLTTDGQEVEIIANGILNHDSGPDFKGITIKLDNKIYHGDLEIHRMPGDWYLHSHHADPAYNNVILHLVIGKHNIKEKAICLNRKQVLAQVIVNIDEKEHEQLFQKYIQTVNPPNDIEPKCFLAVQNLQFKLLVIDHFSIKRIQDKADRFLEYRQTSSWSQILYLGIMEALGYSKNQIPFLKLGKLFPVEAMRREFQNISLNDAIYKPLAMLLGIAGLLPSQDISFDWKKIRDEDTLNYVPKLEKYWERFSEELGLAPMKKEEWHFFRLRPSNFPPRRLAGLCLVLHKFM